MMKLKMKAAGAQFGPKWAWWWAMWLVPDAAKLPINVWMLAAFTTLHPKGLDATIREIMETTIGAKIEHFKVVRETDEGTIGFEETHNNISHCNAAGCDGTQCDPDNNHTKGDF